MTKDEALKMCLEYIETNAQGSKFAILIKEALAQPEFIKHEVKNDDDWSEWVCPDPKNYLMKCCDCGLVHEAEFGVVRYKSETERDDCDMVDDPNLQVVFRMRRSEEWTPEDTAHRSGGLPMAQPEQEPVAWKYDVTYNQDGTVSVALPDGDELRIVLPNQHEPYCWTWDVWVSGGKWRAEYGWEKPTEKVVNLQPLYTAPPQRTWVHLTNEEHTELAIEWGCLSADWVFYAAAVERKIKEKNS